MKRKKKKQNQSVEKQLKLIDQKSANKLKHHLEIQDKLQRKMINKHSMRIQKAYQTTKTFKLKTHLGFGEFPHSIKKQNQKRKKKRVIYGQQLKALPSKITFNSKQLRGLQIAIMKRQETNSSWMRTMMMIKFPEKRAFRNVIQCGVKRSKGRVIW